MQTRSRALARRLAAFVVPALVAAAPLRSQPAPAAVADSLPCSYDRCALRFEEPLVVAGPPGADGVVVARFWFGHAPDLREHVARSDSARRYAGLVLEHHGRGTIATTVGLVLGVAAAALLVDGTYDLDMPSGAIIGLTFASSIVEMYAKSERRRARHALERAVWWYNRELPSTSDPGSR